MFGVSVPDSARALADAASPVTGAALEALPDDARAGVLGFWSDEAASGFTLLTGNAEYELALAVLLFLWATGRPGVFAGAFDAYVAAPLDKVLSDRAFEPASVRLGGRLGDGSFGQVFAATALATDADVVVKQAKSVQGAAQLQCAEEYMNRRVRRAPLAAIGCAKYLGSYDVVEGAASPSAPWAREGDVTLEDLINAGTTRLPGGGAVRRGLRLGRLRAAHEPSREVRAPAIAVHALAAARHRRRAPGREARQPGAGGGRGRVQAGGLRRRRGSPHGV